MSKEMKRPSCSRLATFTGWSTMASQALANPQELCGVAPQSSSTPEKTGPIPNILIPTTHPEYILLKGWIVIITVTF